MITFSPLIFPLGAAVLLLAIAKYMPRASKFLAFAGTSLSLAALFALYNIISLNIIEIKGAPTNFSLTLAAFIAFFGTVTSIAAIKEQESPWYYFNILISTAFALGAVLSDNFLLMLFFWEGLLISLYLFIVPLNYKTAAKAFLINAAGDVILLIGICLFYARTQTLTFADAQLTNLDGVSVWSFILIFTGTVAKAGAFPFQSWIPSAAKDMPASFMAMLPASIEKLLAVFLLGKMFIILFPILPETARVFVCSMGVLTTAIAAVNMLSFKGLKDLLAWNVVMQIGLLVLAMGLREMLSPIDDTNFILNHGLYKASLLACAFFAVGTLACCKNQELIDLKGSARRHPVVATVLFICAAGLAGTNIVDVFFLPGGIIAESLAVMPALVIVPLLATLVTVFCFAKVFYAMLIKNQKAKESMSPSSAIALLFAFIPVAFFTFGLEIDTAGFFNIHSVPLTINWFSVANILLLLIGALLAAKIKQPNYEIKFNTYTAVRKGISFCASGLYAVDRFMDKLIDVWPSKITNSISRAISKVHKGSTPQYIVWAMIGLIVFLLLVSKGGIK